LTKFPDDELLVADSEKPGTSQPKKELKDAPQPSEIIIKPNVNRKIVIESDSEPEEVANIPEKKPATKNVNCKISKDQKCKV